jgi:hypothetical protein
MSAVCKGTQRHWKIQPATVGCNDLTWTVEVEWFIGAEAELKPRIFLNSIFLFFPIHQITPPNTLCSCQYKRDSLNTLAPVYKDNLLALQMQVKSGWRYMTCYS